MNSLENVFKICFFVLETFLDAIEQQHHSNNANDIKSYQGIILRRIINSLNTLDQMLDISKDPISAYCLLRTIADSICAYCFIYENDDNDEVEFRHYLYLLDGCSKFVNTFPSTLSNNAQLDIKEGEKYESELIQEKTNLYVFYNNLFDYLYNTNIALVSRNDAEIIINRCDWKYRKISPYSERESYNWRDIYEKAGCNSFMMNFFSTFLSQYVHGLFFSNTKNTDSKVHHILIYDVAITLECRLISAIQNCFKEDNIDTLMLEHIDLNKIHDSNIDCSSFLSYLRSIV